MTATGRSDEAIAVIEALLGPGQPVRRLVLDIDVAGVVTVYVQRFVGRDRLAAAAQACAALAGVAKVVEFDSLDVASPGEAGPHIVFAPKGD